MTLKDRIELLNQKVIEQDRLLHEVWGCNKQLIKERDKLLKQVERYRLRFHQLRELLS